MVKHEYSIEENEMKNNRMAIIRALSALEAASSF